jgi:hypothetical protein
VILKISVFISIILRQNRNTGDCYQFSKNVPDKQKQLVILSTVASDLKIVNKPLSQKSYLYFLSNLNGTIRCKWPYNFVCLTIMTETIIIAVMAFAASILTFLSGGSGII